MISKTLLEEMLFFRQERDWEKFHTTRNLCSALCVEASELLDIFRWARDPEIKSIARQQRSEIENEVADVAILLTYLCNDLNISVEDAVRKKLEINRERYPVEKSKGTSTKYNRLR
ncbi:MAG: nucleotide pyrophosphohydrolase [Deltaproteobacteria bacterium]